jgi:tetratricopeptide (TPR) repeat protein
MKAPPRLRRPPAACLAAGVAACLAIAGCASAPTTVHPGAWGEAATAASPFASMAAFEASQRQSAQEFERQGRLADAAWAWEVLTVLKPDNADYRESLASVRKQIDATAAGRLQRAAQAQKHGELDTATTNYLLVLSLQPDNAQAADALRAIERDRNKRSYLGKLSRVTLARRPSEVDRAPAASRTQADRNDLEHASLLATQGELDEAIVLVERRVAADRRDAAARRLLADLCVQKADKLAARGGKASAVALLRKGLKLDPAHPRAAAMLKQLQGEPTAGSPAEVVGGGAPASARSTR